MEYFSGSTKRVDLGNGDYIVLRKLSFQEQLDIQDEHSDDGKLGFQMLCRSIEGWGGPSFDNVEVGPDSFSKMSIEFVRKLSPYVRDLSGLSDEEGNE